MQRKRLSKNSEEDTRKTVNIGVLAVQGNFREHCSILNRLKVRNIEVRTKKDLEQCDGLIIPGGESTAISKLMKEEGIDQELKKSKLPVFGTCAGLILLAKNISDNGKKESHSIKLMDITVDRNYYGSQLDSFTSTIKFMKRRIKAVFIRAPKIINVGSAVIVLGKHNNDPVIVQENQYLGAAFHPELIGETKLHEYFVKIIEKYKSRNSQG